MVKVCIPHMPITSYGLNINILVLLHIDFFYLNFQYLTNIVFQIYPFRNYFRNLFVQFMVDLHYKGKFIYIYI